MARLVQAKSQGAAACKRLNMLFNVLRPSPVGAQYRLNPW
jgi:hypothetical protein